MNDRPLINLPVGYHLILTAPNVRLLISPSGQLIERYRGELQPSLIERAARAHREAKVKQPRSTEPPASGTSAA